MKTSSPLYVIFFTLLLFNSNYANATVLLDPAGVGGFESGTAWSFLNSTSISNGTISKWIVNTATKSAGTNGCYITNGSNTTNAYISGGPTQRAYVYRTVTVPAGESIITLSFKWKGNGQSNGDFLSVYAGTSLSFSVTAANGMGGDNVGSLPSSTFRIVNNLQGQTTYTTAGPFTLDPAFAGNTFTLLFAWTQDGSTTVDPPSAIDEISLTSISPCTNPTVSAHPSTTPQNRCLNGPSTDVSVTAGGTNPTYQWWSTTQNNNTTGSAISGATGSAYTPLTTATGTLYYYVKVTACATTVVSNQSGAVVVNPLPTVTVSANPATICVNTSTTLTASPSGGSGTYTGSPPYTWSSASGGHGLAGGTAVTATATPIATGSKTYSVAVKDSNGCSSAAGSTTVTVVGTTVTTSPPVPATITQTGATLGGTIQ